MFEGEDHLTNELVIPPVKSKKPPAPIPVEPKKSLSEQIEDKRKSLPIFEYKEKIIELIRDNQVSKLLKRHQLLIPLSFTVSMH
jgi:hypothetical protein